jgi:hypothetical protein
MYVLVAIVALVGLWLGYAFARGFIEGFCEEMRRSEWRELKGVWRECEKDDSLRNL